MRIHIKVPASTANLGPGFDCLGLALDLWNETSIENTGDSIKIQIHGEGAGLLALNDDNLIIRSMKHYFQVVDRAFPPGLQIRCSNHIPVGSGLGSSSSAVLTGLMAADALCGSSKTPMQMLELASELEGHPDNVAAALFGGLVLVSRDEQAITARKIEPLSIPWKIAVVLPEIKISTEEARRILPTAISMHDAIFNIGHTAMVIEAFRGGDFDLLLWSTQDRLHQATRVNLMPGAEDALKSARSRGAASMLSGAGPSLISFCKDDPGPIANEMRHCFSERGVSSRAFFVEVSDQGSQVQIDKSQPLS